MSKYPTGFIFQKSSDHNIDNNNDQCKPVHPRSDSDNPKNGTWLIICGDKNNSNRLRVRFVPVPGCGHFGFIEHTLSGKIIHPLAGSDSEDLDEDTHLVYHSNRHRGALFGFDENNYEIKHIGGKIWHPRGGFPNPHDGTVCVLHRHHHAAARFYFSDINGNPMSPYPSPNLSGDWRLVKAFVTPETSDTFTIKYKVGKSQTKSTTTQSVWKDSVDHSKFKEIFRASGKFSDTMENTSSETWMEEREESYKISVIKGETVVVWQYVFAMERFGDEWSFKSMIIDKTNNLDVKP